MNNNPNETNKDNKNIEVSLQEQFADAGSAIKDTAAKVYDTISEKSGEVADVICDRASDVNNKVSGFVKNSPYIAIASALLTGWLIAKLL